MVNYFHVFAACWTSCIRSDIFVKLVACVTICDFTFENVELIKLWDSFTGWDSTSVSDFEDEK